MRIHTLTGAIIGITAVNGYENCNPLKETCAPIPGITAPIRQDFKNFSSIEDVRKKGWTIANYASFRVDNVNGGVFPIEKRTDAPYIWTTNYFLYGRVEVTMQASTGIAVISSAVLMSDTADEVDWEWSGNNYRQSKPNVQTNYFGKGITANYDRSTSVFPGFEMTTELHKYSIDWTAESLKWSVDGKVVRTLLRKDCDNKDHQYPQTPSRFHLGVWVAGDPDRQAEGVRQWAGGNTDFSKMPFTAYVSSVNLEPSSKCAYYNYTDKSGSVKCLAELPQSVSSIVSSSALNTLSAAQPAPPTTSRVTSSSSASSSSSSRVTVTGGTSSTDTASSRNSQASGATGSSSRATGGTTSTSIVSSRNSQSSSGPSLSTRVTGGTTSTNIASSRSTQATGGPSSVQLTTSTVYRTTVFSTVKSCNTAVSNCPADKPLVSTVRVTDVVVDYTTICPLSTSPTPNESPRSSTSRTGSSSSTAGVQTAASSNPVAQNVASRSTLSSSGSSSSSSASSSSTSPKAGSTSTVKGSTSTGKGSTPTKRPPWWYPLIKPNHRPVTQQSTAASAVSEGSQSASGEVTVTQSKQDVSGTPGAETTNSPDLTTSTVYSTNVHTVTSCGSEVESCPARSTVLSTEVVVAYTTVCPISSESPAPPSGSLGTTSGISSGPRPSDNAPPPSPSSSTFGPPKDGAQIQSTQTASPANPSTTAADSSAASLPSSSTKPSEDGSREQSSQGTSSGSTMVPPTEAHDVSPSSSLAESHAASTSIEFGQTSASLYNTDTDAKASGSSTAQATLPTDNGGSAPPVAQNHASAGMDSSQIAGTTQTAHPSPAPGSESGAGPGESHSSTGLADPVPGSSDHGVSTTRSTITRTTTVRLTTTRRSTSTLWSTSATVMTSCAPGKSGTDCSTISSTTTMIISKLVTPVTFTSTGVSTATETLDVALSTVAAQGASGVAGGGAGTGAGEQPGGAKPTLATIAGGGRAIEAVPGLLLALAMGGVLFL